MSVRKICTKVKRYTTECLMEWSDSEIMTGDITFVDY
jgi:hypothetical protein